VSVFDELKGKAGQLKDRTEYLVGGNAGKLRGAVGHVGGFIDKKTGGKYADKVVRLQAKASELINRAERNRSSEPPAPSGGRPSA